MSRHTVFQGELKFNQPGHPPKNESHFTAGASCMYSGVKIYLKKGDPQGSYFGGPVRITITKNDVTITNTIVNQSFRLGEFGPLEITVSAEREGTETHCYLHIEDNRFIL